MKFVLLSSTHTLPDGNIASMSEVVEYDSMGNLMEDLAKSNYWWVYPDTAFKVEQVLPYEDVRKHL